MKIFDPVNIGSVSSINANAKKLFYIGVLHFDGVYYPPSSYQWSNVGALINIHPKRVVISRLCLTKGVQPAVSLMVHCSR